MPLRAFLHPHVISSSQPLRKVGDPHSLLIREGHEVGSREEMYPGFQSEQLNQSLADKGGPGACPGLLLLLSLNVPLLSRGDLLCGGECFQALSMWHGHGHLKGIPEAPLSCCQNVHSPMKTSILGGQKRPRCGCPAIQLPTWWAVEGLSSLT